MTRSASPLHPALVLTLLRASSDAPDVITTNHLSVDAPVTGFAAVDDAIVIRAAPKVIRVGDPWTETIRGVGDGRPRMWPGNRARTPRLSTGCAWCAAGHPWGV